MMVLYSGTTDPYSHRCRFVLFEKGMDFEIRDVDLFAKPEDIALMNPYNEVPILVERDLILYESHIINEYIDERFPHPQLMPGDPVARARVRLFLFNFEKELFAHVKLLEGRGVPLDDMATSYFLSRDIVIPTLGEGMALWREKLFASMHRNAAAAADFLYLPTNRIVELGAKVEI